MPKFCATVLLALLSAAAYAAAAGIRAPAQSALPRKAGEETPANCDAQIKRLLEKNPFAPAGVSGGAAAASGQFDNAAPKGLQLNGIYCIDGAWYFALSDTVQKKNYTVKLGERYSENSPYSVDFFDDETNSVSVSSALGTWTLTLKERDQLTAPSVVGAPKTKDASKKQTMQKPIIVNIQGGARK